MPVTSIRFGYGRRQKPKVGDCKVIRGVLHERQFKMAHHPITGAVIGYDYTGGRQNYVWVPVTGRLKR